MSQHISLMVGRLVGELKREEGQGATEYAMVIGFLVVGLTIGLGLLGDGIDAFLGDVKAELEGLI